MEDKRKEDYQDYDEDSFEPYNEENKFVAWLKRNIINLFLFGLSIYFVFNGAIKFTPNEMDWWEKIVYIFTTMIFGLIITSLVGESGYTAGKEDEEYKRVLSDENTWSEKVLPMRKEAELYVSMKIDKGIQEERIEILAKAGINYNEIFNNNHVPYKYDSIKKKYNRKQRGAIKKAIRIKKVPFVLFGFTSVKTIGRKQAPNENKRRRNKFTSGFITKAIIAIASGSVAVSFVGISLSSLIYSLFQLALWFGSGLIARVSNFNYVVNTMCDYEKERTWYLKEFNNLPEEEKAELRKKVSLVESEEEKVLRLPYKGNNVENQQ